MLKVDIKKTCAIQQKRDHNGRVTAVWNGKCTETVDIGIGQSAQVGVGMYVNVHVISVTVQPWSHRSI